MSKKYKKPTLVFNFDGNPYKLNHVRALPAKKKDKNILQFHKGGWDRATRGVYFKFDPSLALKTHTTLSKMLQAMHDEVVKCGTEYGAELYDVIAAGFGSDTG
jgi:hypothetical protein